MHWIPFWQWHSWTPAERTEITGYYEDMGVQWAIDLTQDKPPPTLTAGKRIGDFEEYENEANDRGLTKRGFERGVETSSLD